MTIGLADLHTALADSAPAAEPMSLPLFGFGASFGSAFGSSPDPLRLDLPDSPGATDELEPAALHALSVLYLAAEVEQTGLVAVAEVLVRDRTDLSTSSMHAASLMEEFAAHMPDQTFHRAGADWYPRERRDALYARLFGIGTHPDGAAAIEVNADFNRLLAALCSAINAAAMPVAGVREQVTVQEASEELRANLAPRQYGPTLLAARPIHEQLLAASKLLADPSVQAMFGTRSVWGVVSRVLGADAPGASLLVGAGQAGQQVLVWLGGPVTAPLPVPAAARWLVASGFSEPTGKP